MMIFALVIAVIGIWGYQSIKASATEAAMKKVDDYLKQREEEIIKANKNQQDSLSALNSRMPQESEDD